MLICCLTRSQHQVESSCSYRALPSHPGLRIQCTIHRIRSNLRVHFVSRVPLGHNQLKETRRVIFIDEVQDAVRSRVQAVKAIAQSEVSAIVLRRRDYDNCESFTLVNESTVLSVLLPVTIPADFPHNGWLTTTALICFGPPSNPTGLGSRSIPKT
jgi:hypothetical protein